MVTQKVNKGAGCEYCFYMDGRNGFDNRFCRGCDGGANRPAGKPAKVNDDFSDDDQVKSQCCGDSTYGLKTTHFFLYCVKCGKNQGIY